jgi:hypothetical protein
MIPPLLAYNGAEEINILWQYAAKQVIDQVDKRIGSDDKNEVFRNINNALPDYQWL